MMDLMWKPFDTRFGDLVHEMAQHQLELYREIVLWSASEAMKERQRSAAERVQAAEDRRRMREEREKAAAERASAQREREINEEAQNGVKVSLYLLRSRVDTLQKHRLSKQVFFRLRVTLANLIKDQTSDRIQQWLSSPNFVDSYERALQNHMAGTSAWFFQQQRYMSWLEQSAPVPAREHMFGSNVLWVHGKTTLISLSGVFTN